MAKLILSSYPAARSDRGSLQVSIMLSGNGAPVPSRTVEIKRAADAEAAFDAYCAEVAATGKGAAVSMNIGRGDRSPPGFKKLKGASNFHPVNV
jgi:hypothetical protein